MKSAQRPRVTRVVLVKQRRVALADVHPVRRAVAARVADLLGAVVQPRAGALFDPPPDRVGVERAQVVLPARLVADVRRRLEGEHPKAHVAGGPQDGGDLVDVARRDRHVVGQVARDAVLLVQAHEHVAEPLPVRVQVGFAARRAQAAATEHERVEVAGEREVGEARPAGPRVERERFEVLVVEVAVRHRHRFATVAEHRLERARVVLGTEQRHLPADELRVLAGPALRAQQRHLAVDLALGVVAVGADPVGLLGVVARGTGEVAARKHAVRSLTAGHPPPEHLVGLLDVRGQLGPAGGEGGGQVGMLRAGRDLERAQPRGEPAHARHANARPGTAGRAGRAGRRPRRAGG